METIKRLSDMEPRDLAVVERVFGQRIETTVGAVLVLKTGDAPLPDAGTGPRGELPSWCDVLEGMSDEETAEFNATLVEPVRLARPTSIDGSKPS